MTTAGVITIFGTGKTRPGEPPFEMALELGERLARAGFTIANGGYGGTMLAAAMGAAKAGGRVIGVTCSAFGRGRANEYVTEERQTDSLEKRLATLIELGDTYVVLPGGTGTLLELAHVWELKNKHLGGKDKSIVVVGGFWDGLIGLIERADEGAGGLLKRASGPAETVEMLSRRVRQGCCT